jgi:anaerobic magnesium-protoporphyrin IX monomethyl ester cyclase
VTDETFTLDRRRAVEFCEALLRRGLQRRMRWFCETRVDAVDQELLSLLRRAGCYSLFYGVESGNQETLDRSLKRVDKEEALTAVRWAREAGIFTHTNFIFGNPFETRETIHETIRFALEVDSDAAGFSIMVPYPGTEIRRMAREGYGGLRLLSDDFTRYGKVVGGALELADIPRKELERLQLFAYARFYLRPRKIGNLPRVGHLSAIPVVLAHAAAGQLGLAT